MIFHLNLDADTKARHEKAFDRLLSLSEEFEQKTAGLRSSSCEDGSFEYSNQGMTAALRAVIEFYRPNVLTDAANMLAELILEKQLDPLGCNEEFRGRFECLVQERGYPPIPDRLLSHQIYYLDMFLRGNEKASFTKAVKGAGDAISELIEELLREFETEFGFPVTDAKNVYSFDRFSSFALAMSACSIKRRAELDAYRDRRELEAILATTDSTQKPPSKSL